MEILEQVPDVDAVLVPCGGGGMLAGIIIAIKHLKPNVLVYVSVYTTMMIKVNAHKGGKTVAIELKLEHYKKYQSRIATAFLLFPQVYPFSLSILKSTILTTSSN